VKRLAVVYGPASSKESLEHIGTKLSDFLEKPDYQDSIQTFVLTSTNLDSSICIFEIAEEEGEYRAITINKDGVKIENVSAAFKSKW
jgi:hypothetical protein